MQESLPDYKTLLAVYESHSGIVNTLWGILQVVSLALLGFVYKEQFLRTNGPVLVALSLAFVVFALGNQAAMARSQKVLVAAVEEMQEAIDRIPDEAAVSGVLAAHEVRDVEAMKQGHTVLIAGVVLLVWGPFLVATFRG